MAAKKKKKQTRTYSIIALVICCAVLLYFGVRFVKAQGEINSKEAQLTELQNVYESQLAENDELANAITEGEEAALAEEYARKKGYVKPDERVYVDITPGSAE